MTSTIITLSTGKCKFFKRFERNIAIVAQPNIIILRLKVGSQSVSLQAAKVSYKKKNTSRPLDRGTSPTCFLSA